MRPRLARLVAAFALLGTCMSPRLAVADLFTCLNERSFCFSNGWTYWWTGDCFWNDYTQEPECAYQCTYTWGAALGSCIGP